MSKLGRRVNVPQVMMQRAQIVVREPRRAPAPIKAKTGLSAQAKIHIRGSSGSAPDPHQGRQAAWGLSRLCTKRRRARQMINELTQPRGTVYCAGLCTPAAAMRPAAGNRTQHININPSAPIRACGATPTGGERLSRDRGAGLFNRTTGAYAHPAAIKAITGKKCMVRERKGRPYKLQQFHHHHLRAMPARCA